MLKNNNQQEEIIFPEDSVEIINRILKRNSLTEKNGEILSELIAQTGREQITPDEFIIKIKKAFQVNQQKAENIAQEVQQDILSRVENPNTEPLPAQKKSQEQKQRTNIDPYKERV